MRNTFIIAKLIIIILYRHTPLPLEYTVSYNVYIIILYYVILLCYVARSKNIEGFFALKIIVS